MLIKVFWTVWAIASLILIGKMTNLEITKGFITNGLVYIFLFGVIKFMTTKLLRAFKITTIIFGVFLIFELYFDWRGDWKTQTIIFQNKNISSRTIVSQMQDKGARGYNRRTVDRIKITPFIFWTQELTRTDIDNIDTLKWDKVNLYINEQGLKGG